MLKKLILPLFVSFTLSLFASVLHNNILATQVNLTDIGENKLAVEYTDQYNTHAVSEKIDIAPLKRLNIKLYEGTSFQAARRKDPSSLNKCIRTVATALKALPKEHSSGLSKLTLTFDPTARRGMAGGNEMQIRCYGMDEAEMMAVVVHELAHVVDTGQNLIGSSAEGQSGYYDGTLPIYNNDPSVAFYKMSFLAGGSTKSKSSSLDFVSGYAKSDPFEDFAETYTYYVLHGDAFRQLAKENRILRAKYRFMREKVFNGKEFGTKREKVDRLTREYDATRIDYEQEEFFTL